MSLATLGRRLRTAREALISKVTQRDVAKKLNLSPSAIHLWEAGKTDPGSTNLREMSKLYNISTDWLLGLGDSKSAISANQDSAPIHLVPVVQLSDMMRWRWEPAQEHLQTTLTYPAQTAAAFLVTTDALNSVCPAGCLAVVSKAHEPVPGCVVLVAVGQSQEPILRKLIREGGDDLLIADDTRYSTHRADKSSKIIGVVTEACMRKTLI